MIERDANYVSYGLLSKVLVEAIQKQRKAHGYGTYGRRLAYWTSIVDRLSRLMREDEVLQKYGHKAPDSVGTEVLIHVGTLAVAFLEFFDAISVDSESDLLKYLVAHNSAEFIPDDDDDEELNLAIQFQNVDLGTLHESITRFVETMGNQADTASNNGGYL